MCRAPDLQVRLKLTGHALGSYRDVERRFGPPLPLQLAPPRREEPGFATWLVRFHHSGGGAAAPAAAGAAAEPATVVRLLGRHRDYESEHAWLIESSASSLADAVRAAMRAPPPPAAPFDVPPPSFHAALAGQLGVRDRCV